MLLTFINYCLSHFCCLLFRLHLVDSFVHSTTAVPMLCSVNQILILQEGETYGIIEISMWLVRIFFNVSIQNISFSSFQYRGVTGSGHINTHQIFETWRKIFLLPRKYLAAGDNDTTVAAALIL